MELLEINGIVVRRDYPTFVGDGGYPVVEHCTISYDALDDTVTISAVKFQQVYKRENLIYSHNKKIIYANDQPLSVNL
jgi:hypothetical protein